MAMIPVSPDRYDRSTIILHWITALLVATLWSLGQTIDWFPKGTPRVTARSVHIVTGVILAMVVCYRVVWRRGFGVHLPPADAGWPRVASRIVHGSLYLSLFATIALGIANAWVRGDSIFDLFRIAALDPGNDRLREWVEDWHGVSANCLVLLAGAHAAAALFHHFVRKDGVLRRMTPDRSARRRPR